MGLRGFGFWGREEIRLKFVDGVVVKLFGRSFGLGGFILVFSCVFRISLFFCVF